MGRLVADCGHEVIAANPRQIRLIYENQRKSDRADAEYLARLARLDPKLLAPVTHRGEQAQADLALLRSRDMLVRVRADLVNHVRGSVKAVGRRVPKCSTPVFAHRAEAHVPEPLEAALRPVLTTIAQLSEQIHELDRQVEEIARKDYPETEVLRQVPGVGSLTALCYVLTLEDPSRFPTSRDVGAYVGLVPKRRSSGSPGPGTGCCEGSWSRPLTTPSVPSVPTRTSDAGEKNSRHAGARTRRNARSWPLPENWPSCCTACGAPGRSTSRYVTTRTRPRSRRPPNDYVRS